MTLQEEKMTFQFKIIILICKKLVQRPRKKLKIIKQNFTKKKIKLLLPTLFFLHLFFSLSWFYYYLNE